jgi:hypothetical protein
MHFRGVWAKLGRWGWGWGCSGGSGDVSRRFRAVASVLKRGRAGDTVVDDERVDDDVAVAFDAWGVVFGS